MNRPAIWMRIILILLLIIIILTLALSGCADIDKKRWWEKGSVTVYHKQEK
jgi:uncharacterized protein YceK